jgi:hypothetical protein
MPLGGETESCVNGVPLGTERGCSFVGIIMKTGHWTAVVLALAIALVADGATAQPRDTARIAFAARVAAYAAVHRELEREVFAEVPTDDLAAGLAATARFREELQAVRPDAREGEFFAPIAAAVRRDLWWTLKARGVEPRALIDAMLADSEPGVWPPEVNEAFSWALGHVLPSTLLTVLPELPEELEYRLVGADLILIDIDAGLVVDILRNALLDTTSVDDGTLDHGPPAGRDTRRTRVAA